MSTMQIHDGAITRFFNSGSGPMGSLVALKTEEIFAYAFDGSASHFRSGDMHSSFKRTGFRHDTDEGVSKLVGTDSTHPWKGHAEGFNYPIALELGGTTPQGHYYRYPFLGPAAEQAGFRKGA